MFPPSAIRQSPTGRATLTARTLSDVSLWCKKNRAHRRLRTNSGAWGSLRSSPLLLQFRLRKSECLSKNPPNKQSAYCFSPQLCRVMLVGRGVIDAPKSLNNQQKKSRHARLSSCVFALFACYRVLGLAQLRLVQRLKVAGGVLAERTDEVAGDRVALIDVSANLAHPTLLLGRLRLGLHVGLIIGVSHCFNL